MNRLLLLGAALLTAGTAMAGWGNDNESPVAIFPTGTGSYATEVSAAADGSVWAMIYHPNTEKAEGETDVENVVYEYRLQHFDPQGNPTFPAEGILLCDYSNWSYTVVNDYLTVDKDGNAIVVVNDCRNSNERGKSYTAYKVNTKGEQLWGEDGVAISDPLKPASMAACMRMVELEDGSYVFAWSEYDTAGLSHVYMQRLSKDGKTQWDLSKVALTDEVTANPYLVNSGENTCILVYTRTASDVLYARKVDFEGESVWGKDTRIYRGSWGSVPIHVTLFVRSSGNGGALVTWNAELDGSGAESAYMSYITADGKLGFAGQSDEGELKLCYDEFRALGVQSVPANDGSCFYALWRRTDRNQRFHSIMMQRVSLTGDLLWGDEAKEIFPLTENISLGFQSVQAAGENDACGFYEIYRTYFDQQCYATRVNSEGNFVWPDETIELSENGRKAASLETRPFVDGSYLCTWTDGGTGEDDDATTYYMTRLNEDGTFGIPDAGVESTVAEAAVALAFDGTALRGTDGASVSVYTATGALAATYTLRGGVAKVNLPAGFYVAATGAQAVKFVVK